METYIYDFNTIAAPAKDLIPDGTVVRVRLSIEAGGQAPEGLLTRTKNADMFYLHALLTVTEGPYANRTLHHRFAVRGVDPQDRWALRGLQDLKRVLESARNIAPHDFSEEAKAKRRIQSYREFDGLIFPIKVGVKSGGAQDPSSTRHYAPENCIKSILLPGSPEYMPLSPWTTYA